MRIGIASYNTGGLRCGSRTRWPHLARVIVNSQAEVVCLQEVGQELSEFARDWLPPRFGFCQHFPGNDSQDLGFAVLAQQPPLSWRTHREYRFPHLETGQELGFARDLLRVDFEQFSLYCVHLKSRRGGLAARWYRQSEALAVSQVIQQQQQDSRRPWFLCGDLNETLESPTLEPLQALHHSLQGRPLKERASFAGRRQLDYILYPEWMSSSLLESRIYFESRASDHALVRAKFDLAGLLAPP